MRIYRRLLLFFGDMERCVGEVLRRYWEEAMEVAGQPKAHGKGRSCPDSEVKLAGKLLINDIHLQLSSLFTTVSTHTMLLQ